MTFPPFKGRFAYESHRKRPVRQRILSLFRQRARSVSANFFNINNGLKNELYPYVLDFDVSYLKECGIYHGGYSPKKVTGVLVGKFREHP